MMPGQGSERGKLMALDALRDRLRAEHPDMQISRTPWGWEAALSRQAMRRHPGEDTYFQAPTLEELAEKLEPPG